ncbi:MAG TPA: methyltransferase domain-containing protein [Gemmatimonadaceae bacterium]|nr:methyltransferase domain-containing protein [Gemmatimonadaceae bacterium]
MMGSLLTPPRSDRRELLDAPDVDPEIVKRSLLDVARSNTLFGGRSAAIDELRDVLRELPSRASLLDVGTGLGDIPQRAREVADENGIELHAFGLDSAEELARTSRRAVDFAVCGNGLQLPFANRSIDIVMCSQVLHHFSRPEAVKLLREMDRVARVRVIVSDIRRSRIAAAGLWLASFPLRFHAVSRHDGVVSVMRGFTPEELTDTVTEAVRRPAKVTQRRLFRVTASWAPKHR